MCLKFLSKPLAIMLPLALIFSTIYQTPLSANPQEDCEKLLAEAQTKYQAGLLDDALTLVNACLNQKNVPVEQQSNAHKLLAKVYHAKGQLDQAKKNLRELLRLLPTWRPDPDIDTPSFQRLAEQVIAEVEQEKQVKPIETEQPPDEPERTIPTVKKGGINKLLLLAGGGAAVAGLVFALVSGGGGGGEQLPNPPPLPPNP